MPRDGVVKMKTLSQKYLESAAKRVSEIEREEWAKIYGGLCHSFPVLVHSAGLAQAVAYHQSKASEDSSGNPRNAAHSRLIQDYKALLPEFDIVTADLREYIAATRTVLAAWVFYKRFAVSVLGAETANSAENNEEA